MPPAAPEDEEEELQQRPWAPPMKMKLAPYAMYCVFRGAGPAGDILGCAYVGLHFLLYFVRFLSLAPVAGRAFWGAAHGVIQTLCFTATVLIMCVFIQRYMAVDGVYVEEFDPPPQLMAQATVTAVDQLPPPTPEMDMC